MTEPNGTTVLRLDNLERRLSKIEELEPAVMKDRVGTALDEVRELKRAFYTFAISVAGAAVVFAFTVFELLGRH